MKTYLNPIIQKVTDTPSDTQMKKKKKRKRLIHLATSKYNSFINQIQ